MLKKKLLTLKIKGFEGVMEWGIEIWIETVWFGVRSWWDTEENLLTLAFVYTDTAFQSVRWWQIIVYSDNIDFKIN
jgi:hypothetical protein